MDVHGRDVRKLMVDSKIEGPGAFMWQQQLRFYWEHDVMDVNIRICDFKTKYFYEWTGNVGRLVITALTDRCYITLTMGLRLFLGGALPVCGTGKTETTKDLARALALPCYVFNCSDQMNYQSMADIFRGLAQTGAWGCFDEFNRIPSGARRRDAGQGPGRPSSTPCRRDGKNGASTVRARRPIRWASSLLHDLDLIPRAASGSR